MAVVCLTSASGSPGVTATAVGLAFCWPRPVLLVEADPTGGSGILAGFMKGTTPYDAGLIELALSPLGTADALRDVVRPLSPNVSLVAGTRTHAQAAALRDVWEPLGSALRELEANGQDVIVDAGRLGLTGSPQQLLDTADASLLVTRANLPSISAARSWAWASSSSWPWRPTPWPAPASAAGTPHRSSRWPSAMTPAAAAAWKPGVEARRDDSLR